MQMNRDEHDALFLAHYKGRRAGGGSPKEAAYDALAAIIADEKPWPISKTTVNPWFEFRGRKYRWIEHHQDVGAYSMFVADSVTEAGIKHSGWYIDEFQDEKYRGTVLEIRGAQGRRYLAGFEDPHNGFSLCIGSDVHTDIVEAARAADWIAEKFAEDARKYQEKEEDEQVDEAHAPAE